MTMVKPISTEKWTYERLLQELPSESRYEIRNYNLIDMPAPIIEHQRIVKRVTKKLDTFTESNQLGEVFVSPVDVVFDKGNVCEPDVIFVATENKQIVGRKNILGSPDLVVEVVSKGSVVRDYVEKKNDYETFGVKEYWLIDPLNETIIVYALENNKYAIFSSVEEQGTAKSKLLDGFELTFEEVFVSE
jgi:Uma2 family endonuclease